MRTDSDNGFSEQIDLGRGPSVVLNCVDAVGTCVELNDRAQSIIFEDWTPIQRSVWVARLRAMADTIEASAPIPGIRKIPAEVSDTGRDLDVRLRR